MKRALLTIVFATLSIGSAAAPGMSVRVAASRGFARVSVYVPTDSRHRMLVVQSAQFAMTPDGEEGPIWETRTDRALDGDRAPRQIMLDKLRPAKVLGPTILRVRADAYGLCGSAQGQAFVP